MDKFTFFNTASGKVVLRVLDLVSIATGAPDGSGNPRSVVKYREGDFGDPPVSLVSTDSIDVVIARLQNAGVM